MAGNKNSGRRYKSEEDKKHIARIFPSAVKVLEEIMNDPASGHEIRLRAATTFIEQHLGKPAQRTMLGGGGGGPIRVEITYKEVIKSQP